MGDGEVCAKVKALGAGRVAGVCISFSAVAASLKAGSRALCVKTRGRDRGRGRREGQLVCTARGRSFHTHHHRRCHYDEQLSLSQR